MEVDKGTEAARTETLSKSTDSTRRPLHSDGCGLEFPIHKLLCLKISFKLESSVLTTFYFLCHVLISLGALLAGDRLPLRAG